ncbi:MAG: metallophosphoesterase [Selenomonadaceae bacterium]|nr:metallophosphoesterase [Selenomonadaceae bacterium]MBR7025386.1 metallophosphoesterase [Selenomonadaceae bacterium]
MFLIITAALLGGIMAVALVSIKFLLSEHLAKKFYKIFALADLVFILVIIGGWLIRSLVPEGFIAVFGNVATIFLMAQLICGLSVIGALGVRFLWRKFNPPKKFDPVRRRMLAYSFLYPLMSLAIALYGNRIEKNSDVENFYDVPIKNLPPDLEGFTLAQISDIHLGAYYSLEKLEALLQRIADSKPDLLAITGDIFDDVRMNPAAIKLVDSFTDKFKFGIYYIHGNHEHFRGINQIEQMLKQTKINLLVNRSKNVTGKLYILGVDYPSRAPITSSSDKETENRFREVRRSYVESAMVNVPEDAVKILLAHHPEFIDDGAERNFALTLTGHTHGSQFGIFGKPLFPVFKYTRGIVKIGDSIGYVHVGNGSWFPFRFGCPPEIAYFTLKPA